MDLIGRPDGMIVEGPVPEAPDGGVELTGLDTGSTTLSHWSYISRVITGPKLQFEGPGRADQFGFTGYISSSEDVVGLSADCLSV